MKIRICLVCMMAGMFPLSGMRLNVKDFGAKGDGTADDFPAIQRALNKADEYRKSEAAIYGNDLGRISSWGVWDGGNPEVFFPAGTYRISRTLVGVKGVTLTGEEGSVIEGADSRMLLLYLTNAFRCTVQGLGFRNGGSHICFWTANQNTAAVLISGCRFERSTDAAIFTESWGNISAKDSANWDKQRYCAPYDITWEDGLPTLKRMVWEHGAPNSTLLNIRSCEFIDCAGAYRGSTDGQNIQSVHFRSTLPQKLPVWQISGEFSFTDTDIVANLPEGYPHAWISGDNGQFQLTRVKAVSSTAFGAPLLSINQEPRKNRKWSAVYNVCIEDCTVDAGGSPCGALVDVRQVLPTHVTVRGCHEARKRNIEIFHFQQPPRTEDDLLQSASAAPGCPLPPVSKSYAICLADNGTELDAELPPLLKPYMVPTLPEEVVKEFPALPEMSPRKQLAGRIIFNAADYGLGMEPAKDDVDKLDKLFAEASQNPSPLILLPGRRYEISRPVKLPAKACIHARGRAFFACPNQDIDMFTVGGVIDLEFMGIAFSGGRHPLAASGIGEILMDNCLVYDAAAGILLTRQGETPLRFTMQVSTVISPVLVENHGADVSVLDCWFESGAMLDRGAFARNHQGTLQFRNILGVPEIFSEWSARPNWKGGRDLFWIENHAVARTHHVRFGGEWSGFPVVNNFGGGNVLIEGNAAHFVSGTSCKAMVYNHDPEGVIAVQQVASMHRLRADETFCRGVWPRNVHVTGYLGPGLDRQNETGK